MHGLGQGPPQIKCYPLQEWDPKLEAIAQKWAERCYYKHSSHSPGENLAWTSLVGERKPDSELIDDAMQRWYDEINQYRYGKGSCGMSCHYTQVGVSFLDLYFFFLF